MTVTYTLLAVVAVVVAVGTDVFVARTRVLATRAWWLSYAIILFFQLVTNGWLTGRGIVTYDGAVIIGTGQVVPLGQGRIAFAPVEDLLFGFAMVLLTVVAWVWLGRRRAAPPA